MEAKTSDVDVKRRRAISALAAYSEAVGFIAIQATSIDLENAVRDYRTSPR